MPSLLTARRRAHPRPHRAVTLHGALATDARFIVGATGAHLWKSKYGSEGVPELQRLKALEQENARLKRMYADMALENVACSAENCSAVRAAVARASYGQRTVFLFNA